MVLIVVRRFFVNYVFRCLEELHYFFFYFPLIIRICNLKVYPVELKIEISESSNMSIVFRDHFW